jgi:hypothetical protein
MQRKRVWGRKFNPGFASSSIVGFNLSLTSSYLFDSISDFEYKRYGVLLGRINFS